jgi:hypothetical protein
MIGPNAAGRKFTHRRMYGLCAGPNTEIALAGLGTADRYRQRPDRASGFPVVGLSVDARVGRVAYRMVGLDPRGNRG